MKTRQRASRGERQSWRDRDAPISGGLLFYRRITATILVVLFVGAFIAVLIWFWPKRVSWQSEHLFVTEYNRESASPLLYADKQEEAWAGAIGSQDVVSRATQMEVLAASVGKLAGNAQSGRGPLLAYVAGHGCSRDDEAFLYASDLNPFVHKSPGVNIKEVLDAVVKHPSQQSLLIIDSGPLEHDLRLGTAVNRFPEILESEVAKLKLADGEELIVLASHQTWERAIVSPREHWSVFGFYLNEALASPTANADKLRFDRGDSDGQISVTEFAGYVQQHVSAWVWKGSHQTRTQRPLLLYAQGTTRRAVELAHDDRPPATDSEFARILKRLDEIYLPPAKAPPSDAAVAIDFPWESAAYGQEPAPSAANKGSGEKGPGEKDATAAAVPDAAGEKAKAGAAAPATSAPAAAATAPPVPEMKDTRPAWLQAQDKVMHDAAGTGSANESWTAADYAAASVRRTLRDMLYAQQKELGGTAGDSVSLNAQEPDGWQPLGPWQADRPTYGKLLHAARVRSAALLRLEQFISALDAAEGLAHDDGRLIDDLDALWVDAYDALVRLLESMDRDVYLETPATDAEVPIASGTPSGSVQDILAVGKLLEDRCRALSSRLQELLLPNSSPAANSAVPTRWLPQWDLAQSVPLAAWEVPWPDFADANSIPSLGFPAPAEDKGKDAAADKKPAAAATAPKIVLPKRTDVNRVTDLLRNRRQRWLNRQAALAALLAPDVGSTKAASIGKTDDQLNAAALQISQQHRSALQSLTALTATSGDVRGQWSADRIVRLAMLVDADQQSRDRTPQPLSGVRRKVEDLARIEGPGEPIDLQLGREQPAAFTVHRGRDRPLDVSLAEVKLIVPETLAVTCLGKALVSGDYPLKELLDEQGQTIDLRVSSRRELQISSDGKLEDPRQSLTIILTPGAGGNRLTSIGVFRLPARHLDVIVGGFDGTIDHRPEHAEVGGTGANRLYHLNPPPTPEEVATAADRGRVQVHLRPMPRGETSYQLFLVNRSTVARNVIARWHVLADRRPASGWTEVEGQIGEASQKQRLKPELLDPGEKWLVPLFEEDQKFPPPATPPPAAAASPPPPPAEPKPPLPIGSGLVCQLTDLGDPNWSQWIWITAQPRHPNTYVLRTSRLTGNTGIVETALRDHPQSSALLPPGRMTNISGNPRSGLEGKRVAFSQKEVAGVLAKGDLTIVAQLPARGPNDDEPIPFSLDVDGYPRALRFVAGTSDVRVPADRGAVQLKPLSITDPPMPDKEDTLLTSGQLFFTKAPKLRCEIEADFPTDQGNYAVRLVRADEFSQQLDEFYADRQFTVECRRQPAEESAKTNLSLACRVQELGGPLDWLTADTGFVPPLSIKLRAEIVQYDLRGRFEPLKNPVLHELEIVLDDQPPRLSKSPAATLDWDKRKPLPLIAFSLADDDAAGSGSGLAEVEWGTLRKGEDALMDGKKLPLPASSGLEVPLHIAVPKELLLMEGKPVSILLVARDRAGNRYGPEVLQTINVKAVPGKAQAPKGSDAKK